jgi:hypothetical protein
MDQVMVVMETALEKEVCGVQIGVTKIDSTVTFLQHEKGAYYRSYHYVFF